jgi:hypothetical protein
MCSNLHKTGRKQLRTEKLGETWLEGENPQRVVVPNDDDDISGTYSILCTDTHIHIHSNICIQRKLDD